MAFKLLVIACALSVVVVNANFAWDNNAFNFQFPEFKPIPPIKPFQINFPAFPKLPTAEEIIEQSKNNPNANVNVVQVKSKSSSQLGPDGKVIKTGGTTVYTRNNDETRVLKFGDNPPDIKTTSSTPSSNPNDKNQESTPNVPVTPITLPVLPQIQLPQIPVWQPFDLLKPVMDAVNTNMNNINNINNYQAVANNNGGFQAVVANSDNGGYQAAFSSSNGGGSFASSSSSFSSAESNINGVKTGGGVASTSYNVNGETGGKTIIYTV